jgi:hypothetical protein
LNDPSALSTQVAEFLQRERERERRKKKKKVRDKSQGQEEERRKKNKKKKKKINIHTLQGFASQGLGAARMSKHSAQPVHCIHAVHTSFGSCWPLVSAAPHQASQRHSAHPEQGGPHVVHTVLGSC